MVTTKSWDYRQAKIAQRAKKVKVHFKPLLVMLFSQELVQFHLESPCTSKSGQVSFRIYDKRDGKTKNDYFREMVTEVQGWGLKPDSVTGDSWYSGNTSRLSSKQC